MLNYNLNDYQNNYLIILIKHLFLINKLELNFIRNELLIMLLNIY